jgi:hypothetical protein
MSTTPILQRRPTVNNTGRGRRDPRTIWLAIVTVIAIIAIGVAVAYATGLIGGNDSAPDSPAAQPPAADAPADDPAGQPPAAIRYGEEPRANWDVTGVAADDVLNVRGKPGVDGTIVATLPHNAAELESTGRIAHIGDQLWREMVVPGDGAGWVNAAFLTETK